MFLTLLFAEHMLPSGLKLSYPWPFVALGFLSFTEGGRGGGEVKGGGAGAERAGGDGGFGTRKGMLSVGRLLSEPGKPNCHRPKVLPSTPLHPARPPVTDHGLVASSFTLWARTCARALTDTTFWNWLLDIVRHKPCRNRSRLRWGRTHSREPWFLGGQRPSRALTIAIVSVSCYRIAGVETRDARLAEGWKGREIKYIYIFFFYQVSRAGGAFSI